MIFSYNRPSDLIPALDGTAAWLSDDVGLALVNGKPNVKSRASWITGTQTTSSETVVSGTWSTGLVPRVAALIGVSLPIGMVVTVDFYENLSWGYSSVTTAVMEMDNGTNGIWVVLPTGLSAVTGVRFHLVNNVSGSTVMAAGDTFDMGEMWVGSSPTYQIIRTVQDNLVDPSVRHRTLGQQVYTTKRLPYRTLSLDVMSVADPNVSASRLLRASTSQSVPCVMVLQEDYKSAALFCNVTSFTIENDNGALWKPSIQFEEVPNG